MEISTVESDVVDLISQKNYPCIAAVQALHRKELIIKSYEGFGTGKSSRLLAQDLIQFKKLQLDKKAPYLTYIAVFPKDVSANEEDFERDLWLELSAMWSHPDIAGHWDSNFSDNPEDKNFCFSLDGTAFFVVGVHPQSSRLSRRLPYNALIFNLYSQFTDLMEKGQYDSMVQLNRKRDLRFQGSINPMVEAHNEFWEAIQFSGKNNSNEWRCPFTKGLMKGVSWMLKK